jgi:serine/threonine protein kinase
MSLKKLGRYDLTRVLGKGAMGLVYEGRDPNLDRRVAIKTIKVENLSDESAAEYEVRFRTEARSAARLQHPNIVSVYDSDRDGDIAFLVMEFIQGDDLKHHLDKGDLYTLTQTLGIMGDLLSALEYAHKQNIVHRDIKPANLLIEPGGRIKLTDFGVARIQDSGDATRTQGSIVGTLKYMSPEQLQGRPIDARADLFAAGVVLYQLLTGKRPFDGDTDFAVIQQIVGHSPAAPTSFNAKLPASIDAVVARSLAKSRDQRFNNAQEFSQALLAACRDAADLSVLPPVSAPASSNSSTWTATLMAGEALVGTSGTGAVTHSGTSTSIVTQELELVYWKDMKDSEDAADFHDFLAKFPAGIYADLARRRLKKLGGSRVESGLRSMPGGALDLTVAQTREQDNTLPTPPRSGSAADQAWKALEVTPAQTPVGVAADDPDATRMGASAWVAVDSTSAGTKPAANGVAEALPEVKPGSTPVPTTEKPRGVIFAFAGIAVVALAGLSFKFMHSSTGNDGVPAVQPVASTPIDAASVSASGAVAAASLPAPALAAPQAASAAVVAASHAKAAAATLAAAKKSAVEKEGHEKLAKQAASKTVTVAPLTGARVASVPSGARSPKDACEDRVLLGFQICMSEQCAKPGFANHPVCVERRAMNQQREADHNR